MLRLLDRLIYREIVGPWLFGVGLFTALIMAGTYLNRLAEYLQNKVPVGLVLELSALFIPAILVKTFSMAVLLAALLAFGRLSSDSEIVALRAGGASIARIVRPVMVFSLVVAVFTFAFNEAVVPNATARSLELMNRIASELNPTAPRPIAYTVMEKSKLKAFITAENISPATKTLSGVTIIAFNDEGDETFMMKAKEIADLDLKDPSSWRVRGGARLISADFQTVVDVPTQIWPTQVPRPNQPFEEVVKQGRPEFDAMSMTQLQELIRESKRLGNHSKPDIANFEYGYWSKISVPLAALVFGTLGAVLGIRGHRTGTSTGFALSIAIIFGYVTLANFMNVWAMGGVIPAYVASFTPLVVGMVVALFIMWKRNG
ncbi:MAG TPA: LptF/LptG family permease [Fimbriimonas sp.]